MIVLKFIEVLKMIKNMIKILEIMIKIMAKVIVNSNDNISI